MTDHPGFLAAILAAPDDDTPRLVYADWLEENAGTVPCPECNGVPRTGRGHPYFWQCRRCEGTGRVSDGRQERAEFIRVQCERARTGLGPYGVGPAVEEFKRRRDALRRRERELLEAVGLWWAWPGPADWAPQGWTWRRGFLDSVTCTAADWHAHGKAILAAQPVREVRLSGCRVEETVWATDTAGEQHIGPGGDATLECVVASGKLLRKRHDGLIMYAVINGPALQLTPRIPSATR